MIRRPFKKKNMNIFTVTRDVTIVFLLSIFNETKNTCLCDCFDPKPDAKAIVDSNFDGGTMGKILVFRTREQCAAINTAIAPMNNVIGGRPLVDPEYMPITQLDYQATPLDDLVFALCSDSTKIFSRYLRCYLDQLDETSIIFILVQVDDREKLKDAYNNEGQCFDDARRKQRHPFANALKVWAEGNRADPSKPGCPDDSCLQGQLLSSEQPHWNKKRTALEEVLMKRPEDQARNAIKCYETKNNVPTDLIKDITRTIKNHDLVDLYTSLAHFIVSKYDYLAQKLHDNAADNDQWFVWIIILSVYRGDQMNLIDDAFKKQYKISLKEYIKKCKVDDAYLHDLLGDLVDPASVSKRQSPASPPVSPALPKSNI